jgi:hypothetical protein
MIGAANPPGMNARFTLLRSVEPTTIVTGCSCCFSFSTMPRGYREQHRIPRHDEYQHKRAEDACLLDLQRSPIGSKRSIEFDQQLRLEVLVVGAPERLVERHGAGPKAHAMSADREEQQRDCDQQPDEHNPVVTAQLSSARDRDADERRIDADQREGVTEVGVRLFQLRSELIAY